MLEAQRVPDLVRDDPDEIERAAVHGDRHRLAPVVHVQEVVAVDGDAGGSDRAGGRAADVARGVAEVEQVALAVARELEPEQRLLAGARRCEAQRGGGAP
jgi:hypothetical protein